MAKDFELKNLGCPDNLINYINDLNPVNNPILEELSDFNKTYPLGHMQITQNQASFLQFAIKSLNIESILEVGVFTGYSALICAEALPNDGKLTAVDISKEHTDIAQKFWEKSGVREKIELIIKDGIEASNQFLQQKRKFDLIFIDANKQKYFDYYDLSKQLLSKNGIIIFDNILWRGLVADENNSHRLTIKLREFNKYVFDDPETNCTILPFADGMLLVSIKN